VLLHEKLKYSIGLPLHKWMDEMEWNKRETSHLAAVKDELLFRLKKTAWARKYLMSFKNGTLNLKENKFTQKHHRYDYLTHIALTLIMTLPPSILFV